MIAAPDSSLLVTLGIGALVAWRLASRVRRMIGRQRLRPVRAWLSLILLPLLLVLLALGTLAHPTSAAALLVGALAGVGLGRLGTRLTRFEATPAGLFYTPNAHLGIALSVLLVLRLGYRALRLYAVGQSFDPATMQPGRSPLTLLILGLFVGYYATYAFGLLRWRAREHARAESSSEAAR